MDWTDLEEVPAERNSSSPAASSGWEKLEALPEINPPSGQEVRAAPPQDTSILRYPRMFYQSAIGGLVRDLGLPGDLELGANALLPSRTAIPPSLMLPTSSEVQDWAVRHGVSALPTPDVTPQGAGERGFAGAVQGAYAGAPLVLAGPAGAAARVPALLGSAVGGGVEGITDSPIAGAGAGALVGGLGAGSTLIGALGRTARQFGTASSLEEAGQFINNARLLSMPAGRPIVAGGGFAGPGTTLAKLQADSPEDLAYSLLASGSRGTTYLRALQRESPEAANELLAGMLQDRPAMWHQLNEASQNLLVPDRDQRRFISYLTTSGTRGQHSLEALVGERVGEAGAELASPLFHGLHPLVAGGAGALLGLSAPSLVRGARLGLTNPYFRTPALIGGIAGGNTLIPAQ